MKQIIFFVCPKSKCEEYPFKIKRTGSFEEDLAFFKCFLKN